MIISLEEMKNYLRIDFDDDDALLENLIVSSERLCCLLYTSDAADE